MPSALSNKSMCSIGRWYRPICTWASMISGMVLSWSANPDHIWSLRSPVIDETGIDRVRMTRVSHVLPQLIVALRWLETERPLHHVAHPHWPVVYQSALVQQVLPQLIVALRWLETERPLHHVAHPHFSSVVPRWEPDFARGKSDPDAFLRSSVFSF